MFQDSPYEGFGLPIIEAQAVGRVVITSNIEPMKSVAGNGACLVDPYDVASIKSGIMKVINDNTYRANLISNGFENVLKYRATTIGECYKSIYQSVTY